MPKSLMSVVGVMGVEGRKEARIIDEQTYGSNP